MNATVTHRQRDPIRLQAAAGARTQWEQHDAGSAGRQMGDMASSFHIAHKDGIKIRKMHIALSWVVG
jgi:hypothetical protein